MPFFGATMKVVIPRIIRWIYPRRIWTGPAEGNQIYLTFDDGPIPEVTPWVLDLLKEYRAKATFFCIGDNVKKHPEIFRRIVAEGHSIGNHTFNHLNGWSTDTSHYVQNVLKAEKILEINSSAEIRAKNRLFRPPFGRLRPLQAKELQKRGFKLVMWEIISEDYDRKVSSEKCFDNVSKNAKPGSIIVFHDSLKAQKNLEACLPKVLELFSQKGYVFAAL